MSPSDKNKFCQHCGFSLENSMRFCGSCGAKQDPAQKNEAPAKPEVLAVDLDKSFFDLEITEIEIRNLKSDHSKAISHGIILTNLSILKDLLGESYLDFEITLREYSLLRRLHGIKYHILDVSRNRVRSINSTDWQDHVELLRQALDLLTKTFNTDCSTVFIVGDSNVIPMAVFDNSAGYDADVDSDLPYSTLSDADPFVDESALDFSIKVGRLPTGKSDHGLILKKYSSNIKSLNGSSIDSCSGFGVTAAVWEGASKAVSDNVGGMNLHNSPPIDLINNPGEYDSLSTFHFFNVHGSDMDCMWFGQEGAEYPPVVSPKNFETIKVINVVAVEACYGARFIDLPIEESILLTSLLNKTVAFSGSSRIALGPSVPPIGLADIIANDFLIGVKNNGTSGEAFVNSRLTVLECELLDPAGILTVVEFNLFGDPSLRFPDAARKAKAETISRVSKPTSKSIIDDPLSSVRRSLDRARRQTRVTMPDYLGAARDASDSVWAEIENTINRHIYREHPEFEGQSPTVNLLHLGREKLKSAQFSYSKRLGPIFSGIVLYVKEDGSIISKYQTK